MIFSVMSENDGTKWSCPVTDGGKVSKAGRLKLILDDSGRLQTVREPEAPDYPNLLQTVFENGRMIRSDVFSNIRARAVEGL